MRAGIRPWAGVCLLLCAWAVGGCAGYSQSFRTVEGRLAGQDPQQALSALEELDHPQRDTLLYHLNRGMLLRMSGEVAASTREFEAAKSLAERLSALSLREQGTALILNDATRSYESAPYERVLIHFYAALNHLESGDLTAARVEALQVDLRLRELAQSDAAAPFHSDPFSLYLTGLIYQELGEWDDAMIALRRAYNAYREHRKKYPLGIPEFLQHDLVEAAERVGLTEEREQYRDEFNLGETGSGAGDAEAVETGELVVLFHLGWPPRKVERSLTTADPGTGTLVRIAVPEYVRRPSHVLGGQVSACGGTAQTETVSRLGEIAIRELDAHLPAITARAVARAVLKYVASRKAAKKNEWGGFLLSVAGALVERADTRSWLTLPEQIAMARLRVVPGTCDTELQVLGRDGSPLFRKRMEDVLVRPGRRTYLSLHWFPPETETRR